MKIVKSDGEMIVDEYPVACSGDDEVATLNDDVMRINLVEHEPGVSLY